jgi:hypothetical protein
MINEWKDYYSNDYIIFSINNGIENDQYFSTKYILNTYQSRVEFIIDNIEDFSFKNEDYINSVENDFHINYVQQLLDVEENKNKKKLDIVNEESNKNDNEENKQMENLNLKDLKNPIEKSQSSEGFVLEHNANNILIEEFLREEDFAIDNELLETKIINNQNKNTDAINNNNIILKKVIDDDIKQDQFKSNKANIETEKDEKIMNSKNDSNLPLQKHDKNKKIYFKNFNNGENISSMNEPKQKNSLTEKIIQKELKIQIEKNDSPKEDSKESSQIYERKNANYKTLINNLKNQEQNDEINKYYSRNDKIENYAVGNKMIDNKVNNLYPKDNENENENMQISNSINSNNSNDFNNFNSENNEIPDYEKYPKIYSRAQSYTTRSRDDEIKSLNDKLYSYKNQNKVILDENKKLLEIINIFKILQNLENSKQNTNSNNIASVNENLDSDGINRDNESINKNNDLIIKKDSHTNIIKLEGGCLKQEDKFKCEENQTFDNYELLEFERFAKNEKKLIKNIDFSYANKFLNSNHFGIEDDNLNKPINDGKIYKSENVSINNRYDNINESTNLNLKNNLLLSDQKNEDDIHFQNQKNFNISQNYNYQNTNLNNESKKNVNETILKNNFINNKNISNKNQKICISVKSSENLISPTNNDLIINDSINNNKKKTFIKIDDNSQNKESYYSKNQKIMMNYTKSNDNKIRINDKKILLVINLKLYFLNILKFYQIIKKPLIMKK